MLQPSPGLPSGSALASGRVDVGQFLDLDAAAFQINQEQRNVVLASARSGTRGDHGKIRNRTIGNRLLHPVQGAAVRGQLDRFRRWISRALEQRQRTDGFAGSDLRQPFLFLCIRARQQQRFGGEVDGRRERHRRQRAADFLRDHAKLEMAGTRAAELFGNRDTEKTHLGEALPQFLVVGRLAVEHHAHRFRRAPLGEILPRLIAELLLVVGEIEVHGLLVLAGFAGWAERSDTHRKPGCD
jgi:hypothetical protein